MSYYTQYGTTSPVRVTELSLWIPYIGLWTADITAATGDALPTSGTLTHGNLSLQGTVYRQATLAGITKARLVGGSGGWGTQLSPRGYSNPFGVLRSLVVNDTAVECGEKIAVLSDASLGSSWARPGASGGSVLRAACGSVPWWINAAGVVQVGPRISSPILTSFQVTEWDGSAGIVTVATEDIASWQPGATFQSQLVQPMQTISAVKHVADNSGKGRTRVLVT